MDVRCPQCQTLYELDESQIRSQNATLKCSSCDHVFPLDSRRTISQENQRRWMIRKQETGDVLYLNSFDVLHQWIMERQVGENDRISRTGDKWVTLGSIGEFTPVFQVVASISSLSSERAGASPGDSHIATRVPSTDQQQAVDRSTGSGSIPAVSPEAESDVSGERRRVRTSLQYSNPGPQSPEPADESDEEVTQRARPSVRTPMDLPPRPRQNTPDTDRSGERRVQLDSNMFPSAPAEEQGAWEIGDSGTHPAARADQSGTHRTEYPARSKTLWVLPLLAIFLIGGAAYVYLEQPGLIDGVVEKNRPEVVKIGADERQADETAPNEAIPAARRSLSTAFEQADSQLREKEARLFAAAVEATSEPLTIAVQSAEEKAKVDTADSLLSDAKKALQSGRHDRARALFHRVLEKDSGNAEAITGLGWSLLELSQPASAAAQFKKALHHNPGYGDAYIGLGSAQRQLGNYQEAYDAYDRYLGRHPKGPKASIASYQLEQLRKQLGM